MLPPRDSARGFAIAGLSALDRDLFGVFPLRGKPLNVREATAKQLIDNAEFNAIKRILGLAQGKVYKDASELRYGRILILSDADVDGSHIKGLLLNMIHHFWPSLLIKIDGFATSLLTPIVKATKGKVHALLLHAHRVPRMERRTT